ncbi:hypothetical protein BHE74_00005962 [Ensete ventricosum]|uniref:Uncharacterized protein n=1 Tax=Ensete ventricosum TaxID=4639 RepID=A0A426Y3U0_ENSVE|nr:hypothetical protein B296_00039155 [Ensete ventricosum]RWW85344.1 hypothetical protein BHE74_00005962 [Ensete ventricosum]
MHLGKAPSCSDRVGGYRCGLAQRSRRDEVPDMTPLTVKLVSRLFFREEFLYVLAYSKKPPFLELLGGGFILAMREVGRTLSHTSEVTSGVAASYGESVGAKAWSESVALLVALMARGGSSASMASGRFHLGC